MTNLEDLDPPACPWCGAMAGVCSDYPNCPAGGTPGKPPEIVFAPGAFDAFKGAPEELAELVAEIHRMFANGVPEGAKRLDEDEAEAIREQLKNKATRQ